MFIMLIWDQVSCFNMLISVRANRLYNTLIFNDLIWAWDLKWALGCTCNCVEKTLSWCSCRNCICSVTLSVYFAGCEVERSGCHHSPLLQRWGGEKEEGAGNGMKTDGSGDRMQGKREKERGMGGDRVCCMIWSVYCCVAHVWAGTAASCIKSPFRPVVSSQEWWAHAGMRGSVCVEGKGKGGCASMCMCTRPRGRVCDLMACSPRFPLNSERGHSWGKTMLTHTHTHYLQYVVFEYL